MRPWLRSTGVVVLGIIVALTILIIAEGINSRLYRLPPGIDPGNIASLKQVMATLPNSAFVLLVGGWTLGTFTGAWSAARLASRRRVAHGGIVAAILLITGILNLLSLPHPTWVWIAGIAGLAVGGSGGSWIGAIRRDG